MENQGFVLTRSRSDNQLKKSLVWSPTPIKEMSVSFLEDLNRCSNSNSFDGPENPLAIRKFQSAGLLGMEQRMFERFDESPELRSVERNLFTTEFDDKFFSSSSYPTSEIPIRASNPITRDAKFRESDDEVNNYLNQDFSALALAQN